MEHRVSLQTRIQEIDPSTAGLLAEAEQAAAAFERSAVHVCNALVEASAPVTGSDAGALNWLAREARRQFSGLRDRASAADYGLVETLASTAIAWCEDRADDPRLPRAVRAHARAILVIVTARMRGDRREDAAELMSGLVLQLHELVRPSA
jgi:hypothetical protein